MVWLRFSSPRTVSNQARPCWNRLRIDHSGVSDDARSNARFASPFSRLHGEHGVQIVELDLGVGEQVSQSGLPRGISRAATAM